MAVLRPSQLEARQRNFTAAGGEGEGEAEGPRLLRLPRSLGAAKPFGFHPTRKLGSILRSSRGAGHRSTKHHPGLYTGDSGIGEGALLCRRTDRGGQILLAGNLEPE